MEIVCPAWCPGAERLIDAIPILADQGVTAVEIGVDFPQYFDHRDAFELQRLMLELASCGVRTHSVHAPFGPSYDISSPDDEVHERGVEALIDSIQLAGVLGANTVIVHASDIATNGRSRRFDRARGVLREVGVVAKESGVIMALENLPPDHVGHTPDEILALLEGTDSESVALCFDSGHANLSGHFTRFVDALLPYAVTTHLHDNDGKEDQHRFPGEGTIDWRGFAAAYRALNCKASIMLECKPPEDVLWSEAFHRLRLALGE